MSYVLSATWQGLAELEARIDQLRYLGVEGTRIREALRPGAELIAEAWRDKVPRPGADHPYATGRYLRSIKVEPSDDPDFGFVGLDVYTDAEGDDGFNYPEALEFGTSSMMAQPSAQPAFDENVDKAVALAAQALDGLILQVTVL